MNFSTYYFERLSIFSLRQGVGYRDHWSLTVKIKISVKNPSSHLKRKKLVLFGYDVLFWIAPVENRHHKFFKYVKHLQVSSENVLCVCCRRKANVGRLAMPAKIGRCIKSKKYFLKIFNHKILALGWAKLVSQEPSAMNLQSD